MSGSGERWPSFQYDARNSGVADDRVTPPEGSPSVEWSVDTASLCNGGASPVVADGTVYVGTGEGEFLALALEDGSVRWRQDTRKWIHSTAAVSGGAVTYGCDDYTVRSQTLDGSTRWSYDAAFEVSADVAVLKDTVLFHDNDSDGNTVYALEHTTGEERWTVTPNRDATSIPPSVYGLAVHGDTVYVSDTDGGMDAYDLATGEELWTIATDSELGGHLVPTDEGVVGVAAGLGASPNDLYSISPMSGSVRWRYSVDRKRTSGPAVGAETVYVPTGSGIAAITRSDGTEQWHVDLGNPPGPPAVVDDAVYCATQGEIHALADGRHRWTVSVGEGSSPLQRPVAVADGRIVYKGPCGVYALA